MSTLAKFPKATAITIYSLGFFLGLLHVFLGLVALTPLINQDYHREIKLHYNSFASKGLSFLHQFAGVANIALLLRYSVAASQTLFGILLCENGKYLGSFGKFSNYGLLAVDFIFLFFQLLVGSSYERIAPTIVFSVLLLTRAIIIEQSTRKAKVGVKTRNAGKPKTSTPKKNKNE